MPERYIRAMSHALWDTDLVGVRLLLALTEALWAIMLIWPGDTFARPTYAIMASVMSEATWALVFLVSSVTQATIVLREDFSGAFARYFAAWNAALWCFVSISLLLSVSPPPAAISGEIAMAFGAAWVWARPYVLAAGIRKIMKEPGGGERAKQSVW